MGVTYRSRIPKIALQLDPAVTAALKEGADLVAASAKDRVPVRTGALRDAIHVEQDDQQKFSVVAGDDNVFYGQFVEHGSAHVGAHPFLIPALEERRDEVERLARTAIREVT